MVKIIQTITLFSALLFGQEQKCDKDNKCPNEAPCCSEHGYCGSELKFCNIGCTPFGSAKEESCLNPPKCESKTYKFDNNKITTNDDYDGNFEKFDFIITGDYDIKNRKLILKLNEEKGSKVMLTRYARFATISSRMKTAYSRGVISSFITMSDVKDEIDFEWVGTNTKETQTNFFYRGILDYENGNKTTMQKDVHKEFEDYTIDWQSTGIDWRVGNNSIRKMTDKFKLPDTPSRIELGIWNGGSGAEGVKEWAGGEVSFNNTELKDDKGKGYYTVEIESITVKCSGDFESSSIEDFKDFDKNFKHGFNKGKFTKGDKAGFGGHMKNKKNDAKTGDSSLFNFASQASYSFGLVALTLMSLF